MKADPHALMLNWARWAASGDDHHLEAKISSLWRFWLPHRHRDDGWGDPAAPDAMPDPVDIRSAEFVDRCLHLLPSSHYKVLYRAYYQHQKVDSLDLMDALRALTYAVSNKVLDNGKGLSDSDGQGSFALNS